MEPSHVDAGAGGVLGGLAGTEGADGGVESVTAALVGGALSAVAGDEPGVSHPARFAATSSISVRRITRSDTTDSRVRPAFPLALAACFASLPCAFRLAFGAAPVAAGPVAQLACEHVPEPGRIRCEIEVKAPAGTALTWADAVILKTPPFASALRARVGPLQASAREDAVWRWAIALAARDRGSGNVVARVRAVTCLKEACTTTEIDAEAPVVVGE
jgi:hypothetical protein